jgi:predicted membrane-bound mannosyltransferase
MDQRGRLASVMREDKVEIKNSGFYQSTSFVLIIICWGILLRLTDFLFNRSLWLDELMLALNIINKDFYQLLGPLDHHQGAPAGFLMVEKLALQLFGNSEYALRLFPLISGIISLVLFYSLAKRTITPKASLRFQVI